jgi:hypothetical protein
MDVNDCHFHLQETIFVDKVVPGTGGALLVQTVGGKHGGHGGHGTASVIYHVQHSHIHMAHTEAPQPGQREELHALSLK